jgi:hypothetical protein
MAQKNTPPVSGPDGVELMQLTCFADRQEVAVARFIRLKKQPTPNSPSNIEDVTSAEGSGTGDALTSKTGVTALWPNHGAPLIYDSQPPFCP